MGQRLIKYLPYFLCIVAGIERGYATMDKLDRLLLEVEKEALKLAFNKGGSWERYNQLKAEADAELEQYLSTLE